jgi:hypothetical protein
MEDGFRSVLIILVILLKSNVAGNMLNGTIPTFFFNMTNFRELYLYSNKFTGTIPTEIGLASQLTTM